MVSDDIEVLEVEELRDYRASQLVPRCILLSVYVDDISRRRLSVYLSSGIADVEVQVEACWAPRWTAQDLMGQFVSRKSNRGSVGHVISDILSDSSSNCSLSSGACTIRRLDRVLPVPVEDLFSASLIDFIQVVDLFDVVLPGQHCHLSLRLIQQFWHLLSISHRIIEALRTKRPDQHLLVDLFTLNIPSCENLALCRCN